MTLKHSEHIDQIAAALSALQSRMATVGKAAANPFFKSRYTPLDDIVDSFRPHLAALGLAFTQGAVWLDGRQVLATRILHASGQWIESWFPLEPLPDKNGVITPQAWGSASTYARRYGLQAALGVTTGDVDDDGNAASGIETPRAGEAPPVIRMNDWASRWAWCEAKGIRREMEALRTRGFAAVAEAAGVRVEGGASTATRKG